MSGLLALDHSALPNQTSTQPAKRFSLAAMFGRAMDSLVAAHSRRFEGSELMFYRYPPV